MGLVHLVLAAIIALLATSITTAAAIEGTSTAEHAIEPKQEPRKLSNSEPSVIEERARRAGGHVPITHTSIGFMYPSDTPYLKKALKKFVNWFKRIFGKKTTAESTRRLRLENW
ncbi:hypothetical protein KRP22_013771 [Phytophthora ramorum]|uniref:uncharacterized protein n=1 Tax=Phytophthora ramorum TaxID=164328 RepID=UPI00309B173E|nr:hypothetical protein KRP23_1602 [Phytophthora ramorum]KAH7496261.1 hypothetical protein KRP22_14155 [Phytophthora ramorum]